MASLMHNLKEELYLKIINLSLQPLADAYIIPVLIELM